MLLSVVQELKLTINKIYEENNETDQCCGAGAWVEEPKLNCLPVPEPELRIAAPDPANFFLPQRRKEILYKKIKVAEKVFANS